MKKNYLAPEMVVENVKIDAILLGVSDGTKASSSYSVLSKELDIEDDEEDW